MSRPYISEETKQTVFERSGKRCDGCGKHLAFNNRQGGDWGAWNVDHIVPISLGGSDSLRNYQTLCIDCNQRKKGVMRNPEFMSHMKPDGWKNWFTSQFEGDSILVLFGINPRARRRFDY